MLDQLSLLVDKSLVMAETAQAQADTDYWKPSVNTHLKSSVSGEADTVRARHRDHYMAIAALLDAPATSGHAQRLAYALTEMDNLRAAFVWSLENGEPAQALGLASFLQLVWLGQGRIREGLAWIEAALATNATADPDVVVARVRALADKALLDAWYGSLAPPDLDDVDAALAIARETNDKSLLIRALVARGCVVMYQADAAERFFTEAAHLAREVADSWRLSQILERKAYVAMFVSGDVRATASAANEGRDLAKKVGDILSSHQCGIYLAGALFQSGDLVEATAQARRVTVEARAGRDLLSAMTGLMSESICSALQGNSSDAQRAIATALKAAPEIGDYFESACYPNVALAYLAGGDVAAAWKASEQALPTITPLVQRREHQLGDLHGFGRR